MDLVLAYIDPGSGSLIIQVLIASALAVPFFLRAQIRRAIDTLRGAKPSAAEASATSDSAVNETPTSETRA